MLAWSAELASRITRRRSLLAAGGLLTAGIASWAGSESWEVRSHDHPLNFPLPRSRTSPGDFPGWLGRPEHRIGQPTDRGVIRRASVSEAAGGLSLQWSIPVAVRGVSSPCVVGSLVIVQGVEEGSSLAASPSVVVAAYSLTTGQLIWRTRLGSTGIVSSLASTTESTTMPAAGPVGRSATAPDTTPAATSLTPPRVTADLAATPCSDGERLFVRTVLAGEEALVALDLRGRVLWQTTTGAHDPGTARISPIISRQLVIVPASQGRWWPTIAWTSGWAAYHRRSGLLVWRSRGVSGSGGGTPVIIPSEQGDLLVQCGSQGAVALRAETGDAGWLIRWSTRQPSATPVAADGLLHVISQHPASEVLGLRATGRGDVTASHVAWRNRQSPVGSASPVLDGDRLLIIGEDGTLTALDRRRGDRLHQTRLSGTFHASPLALGQRWLFANDQGLLQLVGMTPTLPLLDEFALSESLLATPAIAGNRVLARTTGHLVCLLEAARGSAAPNVATLPTDKLRQ